MRLIKYNEFKKLNESSYDDLLDIKHHISNVKQDLKNVVTRREETNRDMEEEAGSKGDEWSDEDANKYGEILNDIDEEEMSLRKELEDLIAKLDVEEQKYYFNENIEDFKALVKEVAQPSDFKVSYDEDHKATLTITVNGDEFEFFLYSTGTISYYEFDKQLYIGDVEGDDDAAIKKFLSKIFTLEGEDYTNFIKSFNDDDESFDEEEEKEEEEREEREMNKRELPHAGDDEDLSDQEDEIKDDSDED